MVSGFDGIWRKVDQNVPFDSYDCIHFISMTILQRWKMCASLNEVFTAVAAQQPKLYAGFIRCLHWRKAANTAFRCNATTPSRSHTVRSTPEQSASISRLSHSNSKPLPPCTIHPTLSVLLHPSLSITADSCSAHFRKWNFCLYAARG